MPHRRYQRRTRTLSERFWPKVRMTHTCWIWTAGLRNGYGHMTIGRREDGTDYAHRIAYRLMVGPIPDGLQLDHLCRDTRCVNPEHLEPVTQQENLLRGETIAARNARVTHCPRGHEYTAANTYEHAGTRHCRACWADRRSGR